MSFDFSFPTLAESGPASAEAPPLAAASSTHAPTPGQLPSTDRRADTSSGVAAASTSAPATAAAAPAPSRLRVPLTAFSTVSHASQPGARSTPVALSALAPSDRMRPAAAPAAGSGSDPSGQGGRPAEEPRPTEGTAGEAAPRSPTPEENAGDAPGQGDGNSRDARPPVEKAQSQLEYMRLSEKEAAARGAAAAASPAAASLLLKDLRPGQQPKQPLRTVPLSELQQHKSASDCWIALKGKVYDISSYLKYHPGGPRILIKAAGTDATELFKKHHSWVDADYILSAAAVGTLEKQ